MINRVVLTGRLTREVELRYTQSGAAVASFTLAVERRFKTDGGDRESDFINCVMWRKSAENFANFTRKGSLVGIEGRIQTRNYENQQGQRVWVTEVVADDFSLLESRATTEARPRSDQQQAQDGQQAQQGNYAKPVQNATQAPQRAQSADPFANNNGSRIDVSDDDLPF